MKIKLLTALVATTLTGCSVMNIPQNVKQPVEPEQQKLLVSQQADDLSPLKASINFQAQYRLRAVDSVPAKQKLQRQHFNKAPIKNINYYVRGLMQDLIGNLQYVNQSTPVAVTSFVMLDGAFDQASLLGNQIAESLIHEIHKFGIPVLDFKVSGMLNITKQGDFIMSRDYTKLSGDIPIRYIVTGTMVKHQGGYLVNARIVGIESKAVVASAQSFIPADVAAALISNTPTPTVKDQQSPVRKFIPLIAG